MQRDVIHYALPENEIVLITRRINFSYVHIKAAINVK